jgi:hypothetical protein
MQCNEGSLFDQLVGDREKIWRDSEAERFGGCEVDDEIDLGCQLNRHIRGCRPFENPASVDAWLVGLKNPATVIGSCRRCQRIGRSRALYRCRARSLLCLVRERRAAAC